MKTIGLRKALQIIFGATNIKLSRSKINWQKEFSGFFDSADGKTYYVNAQNPTVGLSPVMYREVESRKDYIGKNNQWDFCRRLELKGFALKF